jgi:hypothetical protein
MPRGGASRRSRVRASPRFALAVAGFVFSSSSAASAQRLCVAPSAPRVPRGASADRLPAAAAAAKAAAPRCAPMDARVDDVLRDDAARDLDLARVDDASAPAVAVPLETRRACACAAAGFVCRAHALVAARLDRHRARTGTVADPASREPATPAAARLLDVDDATREPADGSRADALAETLCGAPCALDDRPDAGADASGACPRGALADPSAEAACLAPACEAKCAACVTAAADARARRSAPARGGPVLHPPVVARRRDFEDALRTSSREALDAIGRDVSVFEIRAACGEEDACLCAQCLEGGLLAATESGGTPDSEGSTRVRFAATGVGGTYGGGPGPYFGGGGGGGAYYGGGPNPNRYGAASPYPYGAYPHGYGPYRPAAPFPYYGFTPWAVSVYSKTKAWIASSICFWYPWYPACVPRRPIVPGPGAPPRPSGLAPPSPPPPILGAPPSPQPPSGVACGDPSLGELTCDGIPCAGDATCTTTTPQCCCDVTCVDFGDCCADRDACCLGAAGLKAAAARGEGADGGSFTFIGAAARAKARGARRAARARRAANAADERGEGGGPVVAALGRAAPTRARRPGAAVGALTAVERFAFEARPDDAPFREVFAEADDGEGPAPAPAPARDAWNEEEEEEEEEVFDRLE